MFYRPADLGLRRFFAGSGQVDLDQVQQVAEAVEEREGPVDPRILREETDLSQSKLTTALGRLEEAGAVELLSTGEVARGERYYDLGEASQEAARAQEHREQFERSRIEMMRGYAEVRDCRREYLLNLLRRGVRRALRILRQLRGRHRGRGRRGRRTVPHQQPRRP